MRQAISLLGVKHNTLRQVDARIPVGKLTCITGVSGSGKSTLVEDCLMSEAARRHRALRLTGHCLDTPYSPRIDSASVPYVVSVRQGILHWNSRSTVGTATGVLQRLRPVICSHGHVRGTCGRLNPLTAADVAEWCAIHHADAKVSVFAAVQRRVLGPVARFVPQLPADSDPVIALTETGASLLEHELMSPRSARRVIARLQRDVFLATGLVLAAANRKLCAAAVENAMAAAAHPDDVVLIVQKGREHSEISLRGALLSPSEPQLFLSPTESLLSFNSRLPTSGRCLSCDGLGVVDRIATASVIADPSAPVAGGGLAIPYDEKTSKYRHFPPLAEELRGLLVANGCSTDAKWSQLPAQVREQILNGSKDLIIQPLRPDGRSIGKRKAFVGVVDRLKAKKSAKTSSRAVADSLTATHECPDCQGTRLSATARAIWLNDKSFADILRMTFTDATQWIPSLASDLRLPTADRRSVNYVTRLCQATVDLGLGHIQLCRAISTLSGGESQRLRIAQSLDATLVGACYALDEPTRGLHATDAIHLCDTLRDLLNPTTSVILVDHTPSVVQKADHCIEMGPGGGHEGGTVVYDGPPSKSPLLAESRRSQAFMPTKAALPKRISLTGIDCRCIRNQSIDFPLNAITCITGVSGSGKSTLVRDVLYPALRHWIADKKKSGQHHKAISVPHPIATASFATQNAISTNPRSTILTFLGLADDFRNWFYRSSDARTLGLLPNHFSPNSRLGQCSRCDGLGHFGADQDHTGRPCSACLGAKLNPHALFAKYQDRTVTDWLSTEVSQLLHGDTLPPTVLTAATLMKSLGLGHLALGRTVPSLSGGECQRLRIIQSLASDRNSPTATSAHHLYILDEPAGGLHPRDITQLANALKTIANSGRATIVLVEHSLQLIRHADWIVDIGPGSGPDGGRMLFSGATSDFLKRGPTNSPTRTALLGKITKTPHAERHARIGNLESVTTTPDAALASFRDYLNGEAGELDVDVHSIPARPSYLVTSDGGETRGDYSILAMLGLALPLFDLMASESPFHQQSNLLSDMAVRTLALDSWKRLPECRLAWFPATAAASEEAIGYLDVAEAIQQYAHKTQCEWFDGSRILKRPPRPSDIPPHPFAVRLLMEESAPHEDAVSRAFSLGQGWISLLEPSRNTVRDFSTRLIDSKHSRIGTRQLSPHIFDPAIRSSACTLCLGNGWVEEFSRRLIVSNERYSFEDDRLYTRHASEALRLCMRRLMKPAAARLHTHGLIDLTVPLQDMPPSTKAAFWYGFPERSFLREGGDEEKKSDWYQWLGVFNYAERGMWRSSSRQWAEELAESRKKTACPKCGGSGLGWEAQSHRVAGISLQSILRQWSIEKLHAWISRLRPKSSGGKTAATRLERQAALCLKFGLGRVKCGARWRTLSHDSRLTAAALHAGINQLLNAQAFLAVDKNTPARDAKTLLTRLRMLGPMAWEHTVSAHG